MVFGRLQGVDVQRFVRGYPVLDVPSRFVLRQFQLDGLIADRAALHFDIGLCSRSAERGPGAIVANAVAPQLDSRRNVCEADMIEPATERRSVDAEGVGVRVLPKISSHLLDVRLAFGALLLPIDVADLRCMGQDLASRKMKFC